ncbi:MAG: thioesterase family protein [Bacteroidaceae bacterium]|nr:thioesterase family protein [Bacteroidaceae bacterium]
MLKEGLSHTSTMEVTNDKTAAVVGSGDMPVLATPMMIALMENAAMLAVAPHLNEGDSTVGGHISTSHLAPTALGKTITAKATLIKIEGRKLHFEVEAYEGEKLLGKGTHLRFVVNKEKFLGK